MSPLTVYIDVFENVAEAPISMNIKKTWNCKNCRNRSRKIVTPLGLLHIKISHWYNDHLSAKEGAPLRSALIEDHTYSVNRSIGQSTDSIMSTNYGPVSHKRKCIDEAEDVMSKRNEIKRETIERTGWQYEDVSIEDEVKTNMAFHEVEVECGDELSELDTHSASESEEYRPGDTTSDSDSSSSSSSDDSSMCTKCGKGPFRNLRVHLFNCKSEKWSSVCTLCDQKFLSKKAQSGHYKEFFICDSCSEIFHSIIIYQKHHCPKGKLPRFPTITKGCSALMKNKCQFCNSFFCKENSLSDHLVSAHSTKVTTKVCLIPHKSVLTANHVPGNAAQPQMAPNNSGLVLVSNSIGTPSPNVVKHVINGKPSVGQGLRGSLPLLGKSNHPTPSSQPGTSDLANGQSSQYMILQQIAATQSSASQVAAATKGQLLALPSQPPRTAPVQLLLQAPSAAQVASAATQNGTQSNLLVFTQNVKSAPPATKLTGSPSAALRIPVPATGTGVVVRAQSPQSDPLCSPKEAPSSLAIVGMFKNPHQVDTGWRSKTSYPCRQCGATSRQPSIAVAHRYLHRGRRLHRCQCGRTFRHKLHLLRHCVQHAEATRYICIGCGETFMGTRLFVKHVKRHSGKKRSNGCSWKERLKGNCSVPFYCDCGQHFTRPSAYIWHQLKNIAKAK